MGIARSQLVEAKSAAEAAAKKARARAEEQDVHLAALKGTIANQRFAALRQEETIAALKGTIAAKDQTLESLEIERDDQLVTLGTKIIDEQHKNLKILERLEEQHKNLRAKDDQLMTLSAKVRELTESLEKTRQPEVKPRRRFFSWFKKPKKAPSI